MSIAELESKQEADLKMIEAEAEIAERAIANIDQGLKPEIAKQRAVAIREDAAKRRAERRAAMVARAEQASALERTFSPEAERRAARFHADDTIDATRRLATFATLSRTSTGELLHHLADAVAANNLALAESVRLEFQGRSDTDGFRPEFQALFEKLRTPGADEGRRAVNRVVGLNGLAEQRLLALVRGHSDPKARLTAARQAGSPRAA